MPECIFCDDEGYIYIKGYGFVCDSCRQNWGDHLEEIEHYGGDGEVE